MQFKKWFIINEMGHFSLEDPIDGISMIDFRFEDYMKDLGNFDSIVAKIPDTNKYVIKDVDQKINVISNLDQKGLQFLLNSGFKLLPDIWWQYASIFYIDGGHKPGIKEST